MSSTRYYVVGDRDVWVIECAAPRRDEFTRRGRAMALATCAAQALGRRGEHAHVCALDHDGRFRSLWRWDDTAPPAPERSAREHRH
jgi:hypothetical protein